MATIEKNVLKGGEFIVKETKAEDVFIPEYFDEEQRMIAQTCRDFLDKEVFPYLDEIDSMKNPEMMPGLLDKAGELGLLGISMPEQYGGFAKNFTTSMLTTEVLGAGHSFSVAVTAHTGIGMLPIFYYGNDEQKAKYLPKLITSEWKAAYCLTEPDSGSDANSGKTKAVLSADGKYYSITGQKMWITNGGFADIFIVFAKIDDDKNLSAFIVEKSFGGITMNEEEKKMGIKGSSTRQVFFNDCKVPVENLLSTRENGFKIAVNILNIGRIKLAAATVGASKTIIDYSVRYANERKQFGKHIAEFGAVQYKLAWQAVKTYASESATYRASQNIEDAINYLIETGAEEAAAKLKGTEQFAIECALMKVHGSETLDYVVDEGVQIYGGMGFSAEAPMDRAYRDSRINRIFEGTNEINRLLAVDMVLKRALKGELNLIGPATEVAKELVSVPDFSTGDTEGVFVAEKNTVKNLKKTLLLVAGAAVQKIGNKLAEEQEILMNLADIMIEIYASESALLRTEKLIQTKGEEVTAVHTDMARLYLYKAVEKAASAAKEAVMSFAEGDELRMMLMGIKRFTKTAPFNIKETERRVAARLIAANEYCF